jgi:hypothetical protein
VLGFLSPTIRPNGLLGLVLAPWSGAPNPTWLVGPRHTALYIEVGASRLEARGSPQPPFPIDIPDPDLRGAQPVTGSRHHLHSATTSPHRPLSLSTEHHCRTEDGVHERDSDYSDHYGLWRFAMLLHFNLFPSLTHGRCTRVLLYVLWIKNLYSYYLVPRSDEP